MLQDAARFNTFTVRQTERILKQFNWDEERLQALEAIAPHLRDGYNAYRLIECFDFLDAQEKARRLLGLSQRGRYRGYLSRLTVQAMKIMVQVSLSTYSRIRMLLWIR